MQTLTWKSFELICAFKLNCNANVPFNSFALMQYLITFCACMLTDSFVLYDMEGYNNLVN